MRLRNIPGAKEEILQSPYVITDPEVCRGRWNEEIFHNDHPIHMEIGMGKGRFLMEFSVLHPEINYVGVEKYDSVLLRALQKLEQNKAEGRECPNLFFLREDARHLPDHFAENEVSQIYLNFSDPWPKSKHGNRRLTSRVFLKYYEQFLKPEGRIEFKTDNKDLFAFSLEAAAEEGWRILAETWDLHNDPELCRGNVMTEYEAKFSGRGNPICKMIITRQG